MPSTPDEATPFSPGSGIVLSRPVMVIEICPETMTGRQWKDVLAYAFEKDLPYLYDAAHEAGRYIS